MNITAIYDIVGIAGTIFSVGGAIWSRRAAKLSKPTGNGFAQTVLASLIRIESRLDTTEARLDRLDSTRGL